MKKSVLLFAASVAVTGLIFVSTQTVEAGPKGDSLVEVAIAVNSEGPFAGEFDTLIAAVLAADPAVVATLSGNGQHTVFAPMDAAFAELGLDESNVVDLDQAVLTEILLNHVVKGRRYAEDVTGSKQLRTLLGGFVAQDGGVLTDQVGLDSEIIVVNVEAANGVIHVVDAVLLPYLP